MYVQDCPCLAFTHGVQALNTVVYGPAQVLLKLKDKPTDFLNGPSYQPSSDTEKECAFQLYHYTFQSVAWSYVVAVSH